MKNKNIIFGMIFLFSILSLTLISSLETTQISYIQKVTYTPYCSTICTNNVTTNSTTNYTTENTDCVSGCYGIFNISLIFAGDLSPRTYEINTSSSLYQNGSSFIVPGVYLATLGNNSDVTGINEKIQNLTSTITNDLINCFVNNSAIQNNASLSKTACDANVESMNAALSERNGKLLEAEKYKGQRIYYAIGFFILGFLALKYGEPYLKGRLPKRDPNKTDKSEFETQY